MIRRILALLAAASVASVAHAETIVIRDGLLHTVTPAGVIEHGAILIENGVISEIGATVRTPAGARIIEARGRPVTPGFIDPASVLGLAEIGEDEASDFTADKAPPNLQLEIADSVNFNSPAFAMSRSEGVTSAVITPGRGASLFSGVSALARLDGGGDMLIKRRASLNLTLGEAGAALAGGSRSAMWAQLRAGAADPSLTAAVAEKLPIVVSVDREADIRALVPFAKAHGWRVIIRGGAEAWRAADLLARAQIPVIVHPTENLPTRWESLGASLENAARLNAAGVKLAFSEGGAERAPRLSQLAGVAVAHGLPWDAALAALTLNPAQMWGLGDRLGSLAPGKQADIVIWDGDPLEVTSAPALVLICGAVMGSATRQTELRDRYMK